MENDVDVLWNCLVDQEKKYWFDVDFDKLPRNKKMILNLPKWCEASSSTSQPKLLRSQRIFNSSLSQHITKHDFNNSILRAEPAAFETAAIELDQVDVNDHECMPTICAFLNHLANKYSSTLQQIDTPPNFLRGVFIIFITPIICSTESFSGIRHLLKSQTTPKNTKIFLVKMIENTSHFFIHFARWFSEPIMHFILDGCAGSVLNYFVTDLVSAKRQILSLLSKVDTHKALKNQIYVQFGNPAS